ncbi:tetratricopeptide repeat protein, partial [Flavobacterium alvei]|uniref:tetratricopeptide repeat protein n=1 Tax=Flavobacterium alvei TaxID=2080416 RepID=UPI0026E95312
MKNIYYIALLLLLFFSGCTKKNTESQETPSSDDSLATYLSKANDFNSTNKKRKEYIQKAFNIILEQEDDSLQIANLFRVANRYYNLNEWNKYRDIAKIVLEKSLENKDTLSTAKAYSYLGDYYGSQGISDTAFSYYYKAEKMYLKQSSNLDLAKTRLNKAMLQYNESDFLGSEISALNALRVLKGEKSNEIVYELYNLLGTVYNELEEYDKAIQYHNKALVLDEETVPLEIQSKATSMNNLGLVYQNLNQNRKAIPYFQKGLEQKKDLILYKPFVYALLLDNLGYSRFKLNESKGLPDLFLESLKIRDSLNMTIGIIVSQNHLSEYYTSKGDKAKALQYSNEALATARKSKNARNLLLPLKQLAIIEPAKASEYNKEYIHINDSLQKADRKIADKFSRIEYETDEIKQENTDLTTQNRNLVYIFGSIL